MLQEAARRELSALGAELAKKERELVRQAEDLARAEEKVDEAQRAVELMKAEDASRRNGACLRAAAEPS